MDVKCANCGEPWDFDYLLHDLPVDAGLPGKHVTNGHPDKQLRDELEVMGWEFGRSLVHVTSCPVCALVDQDRLGSRQMLYAAAADILGDDLDGFAAEMEDFEYLFGGEL